MTARRTSFAARAGLGRRHRPLTRLVAAGAAASIATFGLVVGAVAGTSSATAARPSAKIGGSVSVWAEWTAAEQTDFLAAIKPFETSTGITVNYEGKGSNMDTALDAAVAGGKPPNVAFAPDPGTLDTLASEGKLQPLAAVLGSEVKNYSSAWTSLGSYKGTLYGVWYKAANKNTVWYNPAEFAAAGIKSAPTTWQQLLSDAGTLSASGVTPFSLCGDVGWPVADLWQNLYLKTNGAKDYTELANDTIPWTSSTVTKTFQELAGLVGHPSYLLGGTSGALSTSGDYPACVNPVFPAPPTSPSAAMVIEADFVVSQIAANSANYVGGTKGKGGAACTTSPSATPCYDFFAFPYPAGDQKYSTALQGSGDVGMLLTPTPQAKAFIKYIATAQPGAIWAHLGGFTSPNKTVSLSSYPDAVTRADAKELVDASSFVFSLDDLQNTSAGAWEPKLWADMLDFVKNPTAAEIKLLEPQMQKLAAKAWGK